VRKYPPFGAVAGSSSRRSATVQIRLICVRLRRSLARLTGGWFCLM